MDLLSAYRVRLRPRRVRPECALAPGVSVRLRPRQVRPDCALTPGVCLHHLSLCLSTLTVDRQAAHLSFH